MNDLNIDTRRPRSTDVVRDIRSTGDGRPTQQEYRENGRYSVNAAKNRFGSWNEAVAAAGYEQVGGSVDTETLLDDLATLAEELGRTPSQADINEHSDHGHKSYNRAFEGGLPEAQRRAGLDPNEQNTYNRIETHCDNPDCDETITRAPSSIEISDRQYCSRACHYEHKSRLYSGNGNPQSTLATVECASCGAGIERPKWKREQNEYHYCTECWGDSRVPIECEQCGDVVAVWPAVADRRRFCSYECMGAWRGENVTGEDHPRWRGGYGDPYYGPNWRRQRRRALIRDQARCQDCGISERRYWKRTGEGLSVHHITPVREFVTDETIDHERANQLDNLVTLCRPCHSLRESAQTVDD